MIFWLENLKGRDHLEDLGIDGKIILRLSEVNSMESCGLDSSVSEEGPVAGGSCEHDNERSVSIKFQEFLD
jgi:hypothetical protein